jgi:hypothetical protein
VEGRPDFALLVRSNRFIRYSFTLDELIVSIWCHLPETLTEGAFAASDVYSLSVVVVEMATEQVYDPSKHGEIMARMDAFFANDKRYQGRVRQYMEAGLNQAREQRPLPSDVLVRFRVSTIRTRMSCFLTFKALSARRSPPGAACLSQRRATASV